ncbi:MAG: NUDIX domain-containing protein [Caldiserica bacterium]|nr:NUDIX domain-containing protein [Caldisericota bacterium]
MTRKKGEVTEITAGGIVFNGDKVLVLRNLKGVGVFPKGHVELGESHEQTALREVLEETGLRARIIGKAGMSSFHFYSYLDKAVHRKIVYWFEMETTDTVVTVNRELRMGAFFPAGEAMRMLSFPNDVTNLTAILERRTLDVCDSSER